MRIDFYLSQMGQGHEECSALLEYLVCNGHEVQGRDLCCADDETLDNGTEMGIFYAIGGRQGDVCRRALDAGKPCLVLELGYMGNRYKNLGVSLLYGAHDRIHNNNGTFLSSARKPADRLQTLGVEVQPSSETPSVGRGLVLGQVPGDSQLGGKDIVRWCQEATTALSCCCYDVTFRPHPGVIKPTMSLEEAVRQANIVGAFNSTALVECIRLGVPFFCDSDCQYASMGTTDLMKPVVKALEDRRQFLANLAYCQYNAEEFRHGMAWRHVEELMAARGLVCR